MIAPGSSDPVAAHAKASIPATTGHSLAVALEQERRRIAALESMLRERERTIRALRESEALFRGVVNQSFVGICTHKDGRLAYTNARFDEIFGYGAGELTGVSPLELVVEEDRAIVAEAMRKREARESDLVDYVARFRRKDGRLVDLDVHGSTMELDGTRLLITVILDITERKRLEAELRLAQKLESVGQLAAGIAHEINTPVQFIGDSVRFLKRSADDLIELTDEYHELLHTDEDINRNQRRRRAMAAEERLDLEYLTERIPAAFERALEGVDRVASIVQAMRQFAHTDAERSGTDINAVIETTLVVSRNEYKYVADVAFEGGDLPAIYANQGDLNQLFLNLIINAAHAIADVVADTGELGRIEIATRSDDGWVTITVADTGVGIPSEIADRVFDPFFTTKAVGRGTGQGLAIARSVVERHSGAITFASQPGHGTTFTVRLPVSDAPRP